MEFNKYSSLSIASKQKVINAAIDAGHSNLMYGVTEKIHGANFGIHYSLETGSFQFSRRTGFLEVGEVFYAHTKIAETLLANAGILLDYLVFDTDSPVVHTLSIYGEIYGGGLNGVVAQGSKRVQKEVQYSPETEFAAFDVVINGEYVPQGVAYSLFAIAGFQTAPLLALYETLDDALRHPNDNQSVVANLLGYEVEGDNIMEGVVIRPWNQDIHLFSGSHFILKNKNAKFSEQDTGEVKTPKAPLSTLDKCLHMAASTYINSNRLAAVISKEKELTQKDFGRIMGLLTQDALAEYDEDKSNEFGEEFSIQDRADNWKRLGKELQNVSGQVVREYWVQEF